ncbi:MAG: phosphatase PAP2 family protein [Microbacteriaceae bacterium]
MDSTRSPSGTTTGGPDSAAKISRLWPVISGAVAIVLVALLGGIILVRGNLPFEFDTKWMTEIVEDRVPVLEVGARAMDFLGGGWFGIFVVPIGIILIFLALKRRWASLYFLVATIVSAGLVQILKTLIDRPRPEDILIAVDAGSFPSGHTANAATLAVALTLLLWRWWVAAAGAVYVVLMMVSRTYLGAHWVSDTVGGLVLGAAVAVILWAPFAHRLKIEAEQHRSQRGGTTSLPVELAPKEQ